MRFQKLLVQKLAIAMLMLVAITPLRAQVSTGTILGNVSDPTGAIVSGAAITITNVNTGETHSTASNESGIYAVPDLPAGRYRVEVSAPTFQTVTVQDVLLDVGQKRTINSALKVGAASAKVLVTATSASVELDSAVVMPVVNDKTMVGLPLNGRDWASLATLQPGVAAVRTQSVLSISNQRANRGVGNQITASGARPQMNNYRLDGVSINDYSNGGPSGVVGTNLGVDAVQEFSVVTGLATADYGKTAGGVVNAVTRTGTNDLHGDLYEFFRNSALDARNPFDSPTRVAPLRRNQFGASAGGPIVRNRSFIFGDYEGMRWFNSVNTSSVVPSPDARAGNLCVASGGNTCASHQQTAVASAMAPYIALYPLPNNPQENTNGSSDIGTFLFADPFTTVESYVITRVDHRIAQGDQVIGTFFIDRGNYTAPDGFNEKVTGNILHRMMISLSESHTITQNLLNTVHGGYSRVFSDAPTTLNAILPATADPALGFVSGLPVGLINIGGITNFTGGLHAVGEYAFHYNSYQAYDDLYWNHAKHAVKAGFAFERLQNNQLGTSNPNGQFNFASWAGFLQNQPTGFNAPLGQTTSPKDVRQSVFAGYVTDDYHVARNLTVSLGVRYELATVPTETANRLSNLPLLTAAAPNLGSPFFQNPTEKNFAPRLGVSWSPFHNEKTALHGGYGIYDALPLDYLFEGLSILTAPFFQSGSVSSASALAGTFPKAAYAQLSPATFRYSYTPQHPQRSYMQEWGLNLQQELPGETTLQVGYAGSHGVHLAYREDDLNTVQPISELPGGIYEFPSLSNNISKATANPTLNTNVGQISAMIPVGYSEYNALQTGVTKRLTHRVQFQASYTWAKSMDDGSGSTFGDTFANSVSSLPLFARDRRRAVSDFNVAQTVVVNYLLLLPNAPSGFGLVGWVLDGWQYAGIFQAAGGLPITPQISGDPMGLRSSDTFGFPNFNYGSGCNPINKQNKAHYINLPCYSYPTESATYNPFLGNAGRNSINGPGLQDYDMSLVKNNRLSRLGESFNIQFRAEIFNILNRSNFNNPLKAGTQLFSAAPAPSAANPSPSLAGTPLTASEGAISSTATSSRQMQFALKLMF